LLNCRNTGSPKKPVNSSSATAMTKLDNPVFQGVL
jgi:hypothetical protein